MKKYETTKMVNKTIYRKHELYFNLIVFRKVPSPAALVALVELLLNDI